LALQPYNSRAYAMRASALSSSGKAAEALVDIDQAIQKDSRNSENYLLRATLHEQLGRSGEALNDYAQAIQLAPDSERAYLGRATVLRTHGKVQESLADCYKAIQLNPAESAAYVCRAEFYLATDAPQPALEDINRAMLIGQNPAQAVTLLSVARKMIDTKAPPKVTGPPPLTTAAPILTTLVQPPTSPATAPVVASSPPPVPQSRRGATVASVKPQHVPPAAVVQRKAHDANSFYWEGRYLADQENFGEAVQAFEQAIQIDPTNALALNARGYAHLRLLQYRDAINDCSQAIRLNPNYANAYHNRSVAKRGLGDSVGAREDLRRATELANVARPTLSKLPRP
jgi:tetratricopeptide (TPR) repeat protein